MPLVYLLYRCPRCGHDPLEGKKDEAWCPACGVRFSRGREGGRIEISEASGERWEVPSHGLAEVLEGESLHPSSSRGTGEVWSHQARVEMRGADHEIPFRFRGELLGFAEVFGPPSMGVLEINGEGLLLRPEEEGVSPAGNDLRERILGQWLLLDIRAVQTSSSSLQFSTTDGALIQFRFQEDSPRRWETLLRAALKTKYRESGLGEIIEFQPRIVAEK